MSRKRKCRKCSAPKPEPTGRRYISVPMEDRHHAKRLGAQWDPRKLSWWIPEGIDPDPFFRWLGPKEFTQLARRERDEGSTRVQRLYLQVPFEDRAIARMNGGRWDAVTKRWFVETPTIPAALLRFR